MTGGTAGSSQGAGSAELVGGCAGGVPSSNNLGYSAPAGAGGGAVQISAAGPIDVSSGAVRANGSDGGPGEPGKCQSNYPAQNGTGGAGGGSGGTLLLEGSTVVTGTLEAKGGRGGAGGAAPSPNGQAGGAGGSGGGQDSAGSVGGAGGYVKVTEGGGSCLCKSDTDCSTGLCANVSGQCTGTCMGATTEGLHDAVDCQLVPTVAQ
jgi:hypothetical protein